MSKDYISYWKPQTADRELATGGKLRHAASNQYGRVEPGDRVWLVTVRDGDMYLLGSILADKVTTRAAAARKLGTNDLWKARYHILSRKGSGRQIQHVPIHDLAFRLTFGVSDKPGWLDSYFGLVNPQQLQAMRILTPRSVRLLNRALKRPSVPPPHGAASAPKTHDVQGASPRSAKSRSRRDIQAAIRRLKAAGNRYHADLVKPKYRNCDRSRMPLNGLCYILSESLYHLFPGVFTRYRVSWQDGGTHYFLKYADGTIVDLLNTSKKKCCTASEYRKARKTSFRTKAPCKRTRKLLELAGLSLPPG